jgi:hypothetical protein
MNWPFLVMKDGISALGHLVMHDFFQILQEMVMETNAHWHEKGALL